MKSPSLLSQLYAGTLTSEDFLISYFAHAHGKQEKTAYLSEELASHDSSRIETALVALVSSELYSSAELAPILCTLLANEYHFAHERIASFLQELRDPTTTPCLVSTASKHYDYLDYDESFQLARKCIKALSSIGTSDAIAALQELKSNKNSVIASYARKELARLA